MPKRARKKPVEPDVNETAFRVVAMATGQPIPKPGKVRRVVKRKTRRHR